MRPEILRRIVFRKRQRVLTRKVERHSEGWSRDRIEQFQADRFNDVWSYCLREIPFYRTWRLEHELPTRIDRPADLRQFPILDKNTIVARAGEIFQHGAISSAYTTGGSTGRPARYPRGVSDVYGYYANSYIGRSWWGIKPFDPCVLVWGHAHLFGSGPRGRVLERRRRVADRVLNITRLDAYDLSEASLGRHYTRFIRADPFYLVGYTSAILQLAKYIDRNGLIIPAARQLRVVVLTSEAFTSDDAAFVESVFGARVVSEYGTAETGVIAASKDDMAPFHVIWDSFVCLVASSGEMTVTTLDARKFPLVNYVTGDCIQGPSSQDENLLAFDAVVGRQQDSVQVLTRDGAPLVLSGILPVHILKGYPGILAVQYRQTPNAILEIRVQADRQLAMDELSAYFATQLHRDHPAFDDRSVEIFQVAEMAKTAAGKQARFIN